MDLTEEELKKTLMKQGIKRLKNVLERSSVRRDRIREEIAFNDNKSISNSFWELSEVLINTLAGLAMAIELLEENSNG